MPKQPVIKYEEGEKVLCYHGQHLYEAKCTKIDLTRSNEKFYMIHYNGWNKKWDEWVDGKRILKYTDENVAKQQVILNLIKNNKLKTQVQSVKKEEPLAAADTVNEAKASKKKRLNENELSLNKPEKIVKAIENPIQSKKTIYAVDIYSKHSKYLSNPKIRIIIPKSLQEWLIDDYDAINQQNKLVNLPSTTSVCCILNEFKSYKIQENPSIENDKEFRSNHSGIIKYFNIMLGSQLLYRFERVQYSEMIETKKEMADLYGSIHLLRLFEKLDQIISFAPLDANKLENLLEYVNDLIKYLDKFNGIFFTEQNYIIPPPHYIRASY